jgi:hypothetical protein
MTEEVKTEAPMVEEFEMRGAFVDSLRRNNKQIRRDRATAIAEDAQIRYKRQIEDMEIEIRRLKRMQENMLDLSPENAHSLMVAKDFDAKTYVEQDIKFSVDVRNLEIKLGLAKARYEYLFGGE